MAWTDYLRLIRFKAHFTYLGVVAAAIFFAGRIDSELIINLLLLYLSFSVLLYGGIYTINDVADLKADKANSLKKNRPLPSGKVTVNAALIFAALLISLGLISSYVLFGMKMLYIYFAFLAFNAFYSFVAKKVHYLYIIGASITHPLRGLMALVLIGYEHIPYLLLLAYFFLVVGSTCNRKIVERDVNGREATEVLKKYTSRQLLLIEITAFAAIIALAMMDDSKYRLLYGIIILFYIIFVFAVYFSKKVRNLCKSVLTH